MQCLQYCRLVIGEVSSNFIAKESADMCMYIDPQLNCTGLILAEHLSICWNTGSEEDRTRLFSDGSQMHVRKQLAQIEILKQQEELICCKGGQTLEQVA